MKLKNMVCMNRWLSKSAGSFGARQDATLQELDLADAVPGHHNRQGMVLETLLTVYGVLAVSSAG